MLFAGCVAVSLAVLTSCGGQEAPIGGTLDVSTDTATEPALDSAIDSPIGSDTAIDTAIDAAIDTAIDTAIDATIDAAPDLGHDDAASDSPIDSGVDTAPDDAGCAPVDFDADVQPILSASCAIVGCHAGSASTGGLDLSAGHAFASLRVSSSKECGGKPLVVPYDPDDSVLWQKVDGAPPPCGGSTMPPPSAGGFSDADRRTLYCWIEEGAKP